MNRFRPIARVGLLVLVAAGGFYYGRHVSLVDQLSVADSLRTVAAFVFGVMGAWIGILHRDGLTKVFSHVKDGDAEIACVRTLFLPMKTAAIIVAYCLVAQSVAPIVRQIPLAMEYRGGLLGLNYSVLLLLVVLQLWSLLLTLLPVDTVQETIEVANETRRSLERRQSQLGIVEKPDAGAGGEVVRQNPGRTTSRRPNP